MILTADFRALARGMSQKPNFNVLFDLTGIPKTNAFIGRSSDLALIKEQLIPSEVPGRRKVCVVYGLGGIGKTQLAIEYARQNKDKYTSFFLARRED